MQIVAIIVSAKKVRLCFDKPQKYKFKEGLSEKGEQRGNNGNYSFIGFLGRNLGAVDQSYTDKVFFGSLFQ